MKTIDARGLACPQPVVLARRAMADGATFVITVDNAVAVANVTRMARSAGWNSTVDEKAADLINITLAPAAAADRPPEPSPEPAAASSGALVVFLASDQIGEGDPELGALLMRAFLHSLQEVEPRPSHIICMNGGVRLAAEGSPVLEDLRDLEQSGTQVWLCGTCLDFLGLKGRVGVGTVSNMYSLTELLLNAARVVRP